MHENMRNFRANTVISIGICVLLFISIFLLVMYFVNGETRNSEIELSTVTFQVNHQTYSGYCYLNELLSNESIVVNETDVSKRIGSNSIATVDVILKTDTGDAHEHKLHITVKNVLDHSAAIKDSIICKIAIDINSIKPDCNIQFLGTPITSLIKETAVQDWTDRFGQPTITGSFETKKYSWVKQIAGFDATLILVREFGNQKYLSMEIQNIENLFKS